MNDQAALKSAQQAFEIGEGVVRLKPAWVPRTFCVPGRRLRLHPDDLYAFGGHRGGIDERWIASTVKADNGPLTTDDEGLSYIYFLDGGRPQTVTLRDAIGLMGDDLIGADVMAEHGGWMVLGKFFDNMYPLPHHVHPGDDYFAGTDLFGKPEAYYFPAQYNTTPNTFPYTYFGFKPGTTQEQVIERLKAWNTGDNGILDLSRAYKLVLDTAWNIPAGILHAPGTLCTYEPQRASDVYSMWQSLTYDGRFLEEDLLFKYVREDKQGDYDHLIELTDWEANIDPDFASKYQIAPVAAGDGSVEETWIVYGSDFFSAKRLVLYPRQSATVKDPAAYGMICVQGRGTFGKHDIAAPTLIHFGEMTEDEFFVSVGAAREGVQITNLSSTEPLVLLKHFGPGNPEMPRS